MKNMSGGQKSCCSPSRGGSGAERIGAYDGCVQASDAGMVQLSGGRFNMGTEDREGFPEDGEGPVRPVEVSPFSIDRHAVTNAEFRQFVAATGYRTDAETFGWSFVFGLFLSEKEKRRALDSVPGTPWWLVVDGAAWNHPEGPGSTVDRMDHPVVHVSWNDAMAYCSWAGKRLPTEAEWGVCRPWRAGRKRYPWGTNCCLEAGTCATYGRANSRISIRWRMDISGRHLWHPSRPMDMDSITFPAMYGNGAWTISRETIGMQRARGRSSVAVPIYAIVPTATGIASPPVPSIHRTARQATWDSAVRWMSMTLIHSTRVGPGGRPGHSEFGCYCLYIDDRVNYLPQLSK